MTESPGQKSDAGAEAEDGEAEALRSDYSQIFCQRINERAFVDLESWVQTLIPTAIYQPKTQSYRVLSQDFSRPEQYETLIITPRSVIAYDIHGRRDKRDKRRPTDLVIEYYASINDDIAAALWLAERLGIGEDEREAMGYAGGAPEASLAQPSFWSEKAAAKLKPGDIDGAKRVFDHLMAVRNRTPASDDIIVDLVKKGLGPPVTLKSVRALLKDARKRAANAGPGRGRRKGGPPRGFLEIDGWMRQQVLTDAGSE